MAAAPPPPVPYRHPGRRPENNPTDSSGPKGIDQRNLHIWEHSVTLYHGFDWQASAENFLFLSRVSENNLEGSLCLLNAAIIFARLGEYGTASQILADAEPVGEAMPLTMFVMGHVEFELGNFEKAEDSFKVALNSLSGRSQSYNHLGLDFTLKASHIQQDLRVFASRNNLYGFLGTLGALPADGIFNSPSTMPVRPTTLKTRVSTDSEYVPTLTDHSTPTSPAMSPVEEYFGHEQSNNIWWQESTQEKDVPVTIRHNSISEALEHVRAGFVDLELPAKDSAAPTPLDSIQATPEPSIKSGGRKRLGGFVRKLSIRPEHHIVAQSVDHSRHPALRARDARVIGGETGDLADFILNLPAQNKRQPRDAEVTTESTRPLADFLRGPIDAAAHSVASPASDDASVYSSDGQEAVTDQDLHHLADNNTFTKPEPVSPMPRRKFRDGVASLIVTPSRTAPSSIHRSASTSRSNTPGLTALPSVSTRSSSLRISPSNLTPPRKLAKEKPVQRAPTTKKKKTPPENQPKMVPADTPVNFTDFFPSFLAKRMSEW